MAAAAIEAGAGQEQLVGVRPAVHPHGDRLAAPNQLGAAHAKVAPPAPRQIARLALARTVPPFHGLDCDAIRDADSSTFKRPGQR